MKQTEPLTERRTTTRLLCASLLLAAAASAGAAGLASETQVKAREVLPPEFFRSVQYEIADDAAQSTFFYHFRVTSDYGSFEVSSIPMLRIRLHEIITVATVTPVLEKSSESLARDLAGRRGVGGDSVAGIISDPLGTAGKLIGNLAYNFEETFVEPGGNKSAGTTKEFEGFEVDPGPHKRSAAAQLDVDVYSSNTALQRVLDAIAKARSAGNLRGPVALPQDARVTPQEFGSGVLDTRLRSMLKNQSAGEINGEVDTRLAAAGVARATRVEFLTNKSFSPRTRLYLSSYLAQLKQTRRIDHIVTTANTATTEADALAFVNLARMAAFHELTGNHIDRIAMRQNFPVLLTEAKTLVLALPVDHFSWTGENASLIEELEKLASAEGAESVTILIVGRAQDDAAAELIARGVRLFEEYSF